MAWLETEIADWMRSKVGAEPGDQETAGSEPSGRKHFHSHSQGDCHVPI